MPKYSHNHVDIDAIPILHKPTKALRMKKASSITRTLSEMCHQSIYYPQLLKFIDYLAQREIPPALFSSKMAGGIYPLTKEGARLSGIITLAVQVYLHQEYFNLDPKLACLCNFVVKHQLREMIMDGGTSQDAQEKLDLRYQQLMSELKSEVMQGKCDTFMKGAQRNTASLRRYVNGLFGRYARLLVLRVDLYYKTECLDELSIEEIIKHKKALFKTRGKGVLAANWVGYVCRLEFAPLTGFHFHLAVFMNGAYFQRDVYYADAIIKEWLRLTGNRGRGHNCNQKKAEYRECGIGMVGHADKTKRGYLQKALAYLTKSEPAARLKLKKNRTFFKGNLPKHVTARGRPRLKA
ncbi:inovirus-type Gp2 protein [Aeromonas veronii]|uniref:inovirus-type Gp2 protein n=1 Tax=Aeromonas veronii TaxID=654 RepID=UPI001FD723E4|nr:inovirus-type Gp2 protein [Aeromonas veronii]MCJ8215295.1 inovirus Gp2 family protein [Aeromonas veronii]HDZ8848468.1 inovirus-type Gp2 protein [Aeromonas veronii]